MVIILSLMWGTNVGTSISRPAWLAPITCDVLLRDGFYGCVMQKKKQSEIKLLQKCKKYSMS